MSFFNKICMALLLALLILKGADLIADALIHPQLYLQKNVFVVEGLEASEETAGNSKEEEALRPIEPLLAKASVANGMKVARKCLQCHSFEKGGAAKNGPNLWNILGSKFAHAEGFPYSNALKSKQGTWTYDALNHFIYKPRQWLEGTKMSFVGLKNEQDRADLIAYLRTLSDSPLPLP